MEEEIQKWKKRRQKRLIITVNEEEGEQEEKGDFDIDKASGKTDQRNQIREQPKAE